jgi:KUP system potassium uptake protein
MRATGLVFGDIGTSPIYTLTVIFLLLPPTQENVLGVVSLIIWTLIVLVFGQYVLLAMKLDHFGEGGTLILKRIAEKYVTPGRAATVIATLSYIGATLLLGDGVITPAISILSAVEGIRLVPYLSHTPTWVVVVVSIIIAVWLFSSQPKGSDRVASAFGPVMVVWFLALAVTGALSILETPAVLAALSPVHALRFCVSHGLATFLILGQIILCATGAEALYADMGHVGKAPIIRAWIFVFIALVFAYLGQGAYVLHKPDASVLMFSMVHHQTEAGYIPFLILSIMATVIASQSLISGAFSVIYQAISMNKFPFLRVVFTSSRMRSQIYIGVVNWTLMGFVIFMLIHFKKSDNLTSAYGLAVTGTMTITTILMAVVYYHQKAWWRFACCLPLFFIDASFFGSCLTKFPSGGYWSLIIASVPFSVLTFWSAGEALLAKGIRSVPLSDFIPRYIERYKGPRIEGTAIFAVADNRSVNSYVLHSMLDHGIIYERNILLSVVIRSEPRGLEITDLVPLAEGLDQCEIRVGYMDAKVDLKQGVYGAGLNPRVIFYGMDRIVPRSRRWIPYSLLKRISPIYTSPFNVTLPGSKTQGVVQLIEVGTDGKRSES